MSINTEIVSQNKCVPIFSQKLCGILLTKGFVLQGMDENKKVRGKNVFCFMESASLRNAINQYISLRA